MELDPVRRIRVRSSANLQASCQICSRWYAN